MADATVHLKVDGDDVRFAAASRIVRVGSLRRVLDALRHDPPRAEELEAAIDAIEELIMPVVRELPAGGQLVSSSAAMRDVARAIDAGGRDVSVDAVEALFNRLADVSTGMPAEMLGVPTDRAFVAHLLLLREIMHHGGFTKLALA